MKRIWTYRAAVFLAAFLLFQIQPIMSKALLPFFGGSYLVWGACMVFFQVMLLVGYAYAHFVQRWVGVVRYSRIHLGVLLIPFLFFPFEMDVTGERFGGTGFPLSVNIFLILLKVMAIPFFVLSTTSLILQRWLSFSDCPEKDNPYVLYGASNLGSMLALLTYPAMVEPFMGLTMQAYAWWGGYALFVVFHWACLPPRITGDDGISEKVVPKKERMAAVRIGTWFLSSVAGGALLLAVTNIITFDVAPVPLLWVLPLSVYLLSFVLTFKRRMFYPPWCRSLLPWALIVGELLYLLSQLHLALPIWLSVVLHLLVLFCGCLSCCGSLVSTKPENQQHLTLFYLTMAFGGLVGSSLVSWLLPLVSTSLVEYPISLALIVGAMAIRKRCELRKSRDGELECGRKEKRIEALICCAIVVLALVVVPWSLSYLMKPEMTRETFMFMAIALPMTMCLRRLADRPWALTVLLLVAAIAMSWTEDLASESRSIRRLRNFYGIYKVFDKGSLRYLQHGSTQHGRQYTSGLNVETPLAYYHPTTPAAGVLSSKHFRFDRVDMIGLGTGALAAYARSGQTFVIRELDPDNIRIAESDFTYVRTARKRGGILSYIVGDGRVTLRRESANTIDLLIVDAFNSGSIPVHLLTIEAFEEYLRVVNPDGLILLHVSNKFLNLSPVVYSNARALGVFACERNNEGSNEVDADQTYWMALSRSKQTIGTLKDALGWWDASPANLPYPWTDRYSDILRVMVHR
jgi:hypothetical protein